MSVIIYLGKIKEVTLSVKVTPQSITDKGLHSQFYSLSCYFKENIASVLSMLNSSVYSVMIVIHYLYQFIHMELAF